MLTPSPHSYPHSRPLAVTLTLIATLTLTLDAGVHSGENSEASHSEVYSEIGWRDIVNEPLSINDIPRCHSCHKALGKNKQTACEICAGDRKRMVCFEC